MKKLLLKKNSAVLQGAQIDAKGKLVDYFAIDCCNELGNIYLGRIENIRGKSCFVNYGGMQNGILPIEKGLKVGATVMCQVSRAALNEKGAVLRTKILLTGRYCIVGDGISGLKISKKIVNATFKANINHLQNCIIRSEAEFFPIEELFAEWERLQIAYQKIKSNTSTDIQCIYSEDECTKLLKEFSLADTEIIYEKNVPLNSNIKGERYEGVLPIYDFYRVESQIATLFERKIEVNGIELIFDETEAMYVVDVNARNSVSIKPSQVNKIAADEVARQIRLRNLAGIIIIDFVGGSDAESLKKYMEQLLFFDRESVKIECIIPLSIIAINRKKRYNAFIDLFINNTMRERYESIRANPCDSIRRLYAQQPFSEVTVKIAAEDEKTFYADYAETVKNLIPHLKTYVVAQEASSSVIIGKEPSAKILR